MNWSKDTDFEIIFSDDAKNHLQNILDYIFFELDNAQAAYSVEQDMKQTVKMLSRVAGSLKLCENPHLHELKYRTIHLKHHNYFLLYQIKGNAVHIEAIYHDSQNYDK